MSKMLTNREFRRVVDTRSRSEIGGRMVRAGGGAVWFAFNVGPHAVVLTKGPDRERYVTWAEFLEAYTMVDN